MFTLYEFDGVTLPIYNPQTSMGTPPVNTAFIQTASGSFDKWGQHRSDYDFPYTLTYVCTVYNEDRALLRAEIDALRAKVGVSGRLYRRADDTPSLIQWSEARLMEAPHVRQVTNNYHLEITLNFSIKQHWRNEQVWRLDDGTDFDAGRVFDDGTQVFTLNGVTAPSYSNYSATAMVQVGGNVPITDGLFVIEAGSTSYDTFSLYCANNGVDGKIWHMLFDRPGAAVLPAGSILTIDCGTFSMDIDGEPAYNLVSFSPHPIQKFSHQIQGWTWLSAEVGEGVTPVIFDTPTVMGVDTVLRVRLLDQWL